MKKKYIILLSTIGVLAIILTFTTLVKNGLILKPKIKGLGGEITAIEIKRGSIDPIYIEMIDGNWKVNTNFNIEKDNIDDMLDTIKKIEIAAIVSSGDEEILNKYGLTTSAIEITAYNKNKKVIRKVKVGDRAQSQFDSFGQIGDSKKIYILTSNKNIYDTFSISLDGIKSKVVSKVSAYDILDISITDGSDKKYTLTKMTITNTNTSTNESIKTTNTYYWQNQDGKEIPYSITSSLDDLTKVTARFVEDTQNTNENKYAYNIVVNTQNTNKSSVEYSVYEKRDSDNTYRVNVAEYTNLTYYINESSYNRIEKVLDIIKKGEYR